MLKDIGPFCPGEKDNYEDFYGHYMRTILRGLFLK